MNGPQRRLRAPAAVMALTIGTLLGLPAAAAAQTVWHVPDDAGAATISAALASAAAGDTILVAPGTYHEHDLLLTEGVLLRSATGDAESVTIAADGLGRVMIGVDLTAATEVAAVTLTGGAVTGGDPAGLGGGLFLLRASPRITDCRFDGNSADYGGGIYLRDGSAPLIHGCTFNGNASASAGGGVFCHRSSGAILAYCTFAANTAVGLGGGLYAADGSVVGVQHCTFADNDAELGAAISAWQDSALPAVNALLAENLSGRAFVGDAGSVARFICSDIYGNTGGDWVGPLAGQIGAEGNLSVDPYFCREDGGPSPYSLADDSPCADAPDGCGQIGAWGVGCGPVVGIPGLPTVSRLYPGVPNPFNPATTLRFELGRAGPARLRIYAVDGRLVATLVDDVLPAGRHERTWNGTDRSGRRVAAGVYFCRLTAGDFQQTQRLALVK